MMLFGKKKKKKELDIQKKILCPSDIYIRNVAEYVEYYGKKLNVENPVDDLPFYEKMAVPYYNSAMRISEYIKATYPDEMFENDNVIDFNYNDFIENMDEETKSLFFVPNYPETIYIDSEKYYTHFHTYNNVVEQAEGIEFLPGLSSTLADKKINRFFKGLSVVEVRDLLLQMQILPKNNELAEIIAEHKELEYLNKRYLESVVALFLVLNKNSCNVKRARLFADSFGIEFDFEPFEIKEVSEKRLVM